MKPGASAVRLDAAACRAGVRFCDALQLVRSGQVLGFTDRGCWFISEAAIPLLKKLKGIGAVGAAQSHNGGAVVNSTQVFQTHPGRGREFAAQAQAAEEVPPEIRQAIIDNPALAKVAARLPRSLWGPMVGAFHEGIRRERARAVAALESGLLTARKPRPGSMSEGEITAWIGEVLARMRKMDRPGALVDYRPAPPKPDPELDRQIQAALRKLPAN